MLTVVYVLFLLIVIVVIVRDKRDSTKALAWITVVSLIPFAGFVLYILFGRNHRKEKIFNRKELSDIEMQLETLSTRQIYELNHRNFQQKKEIQDNKDIVTLLLNNNKSLLTARNKVTVLNNGEEKFPALIEALKNARDFIHMEYYIFKKDKLGRQIANILMDKAREGVEVRLIYDDVGSWGLSSKFVNRLKRAGVQVHSFMPVVFPWFTSKVNYRNHRKIVVVDGRLGFTGGINIAKRYLTGGKYGIWRDTHLMIEGEAVTSLNVVFLTDWYFVCGEKMTDYDKYFPEVSVEIETPVQIAASGPDSDWASIMQAFFAAMTRAKDHIYISTPYFLPNQAILTAIKVAALSGVDVRIMIPCHSDSKIVHCASKSFISELLEAKVKVYFYTKGFNHSKIVLIDGTFSSVGTANMDNRSFEDNFEVTAVMYDKNVTGILENYFLEDLANSEEVTKKEWDQRPVLYNLWDSFASLFSPLL